MRTAISPLTRVSEELPILQQTAAVLDILRDGLNDPVNAIALDAWRTVTESTLNTTAPQLHRSIDRLVALITKGQLEEEIV